MVTPLAAMEHSHATPHKIFHGQQGYAAAASQRAALDVPAPALGTNRFGGNSIEFEDLEQDYKKD